MATRRGFTLIEVVVVVGIMVFIYSVLFANYPQFARQVAIDREANRMALSFRKAQSYALAVREFNSAYVDDPFCSVPPVKFPPYGVSLSTVAGAPGDPRNETTYVIFGDTDCSTLIAGSAGFTPVLADGSTESVETVALEQGRAPVVIEAMVGYSTACPGPTGCGLTRVDAVYQRPAPTIIIKGRVVSGVYVTLDYVEITLSVQGENVKRKVIIRNTGQVSTQ